MKAKVFYCYVYLDPRKSEKYIYHNVCFSYEPFYVGKGHGKRLLEFLFHNQFCQNKINRISSQTHRDPVVVLVRQNISEQEAFDLEKQLIKEIGRSDLNLGPLTNLTDGGEGFCNLIFSSTHKRKLSLFAKQRTGNRNPFFGKHHKQKTKEILKEKSIEWFNDHPEIKDQIRIRSKDILTCLWKDEKFRREQFERLKKNNLSRKPEVLKKIVEFHTGRKRSQETKDNISKSVSKIWRVVDANGVEYYSNNLIQFCKDNNVKYGTLYDSCIKQRPTKSGWRLYSE